MGLVVFVIIAFIGTKAFHGVMANQKEAAQVKALTDAVTVTAEKLSALTVHALIEPGSGYLNWSQPAVIGNGEFKFRYRTFPNPSISGVQDTAVVGLQVETGDVAANGTFTPSRSFATLIAPHLNSRDRLGQVSTAVERAAEADFYADLQARIRSVGTAAVDANQTRLNSYSCYDKGQCCGFMKEYFKNPSLVPKDGPDQKCYHRCALAGNVRIPEWNAACGTDFCALAPWKSKADCCKAIADGSCKPGTICANVCIDCLGEDGSTCNTNVTCDEGWFNDFFDCANGTLCNGQPLPDVVPEWGNVKAMCKTAKCAAISSSCPDMAYSCCNGYWQRLAAGLEPWVGSQICATLISKEQCCNSQIGAGYYNFQCSSDGKIIQAQYFNKNINLCGAPPGSDWDKYCKLNQGCPSTLSPAWGGASCGSWTGMPNDPWIDPDPASGGVHGFANSAGSSESATTGGATTTTGGPRAGENRGGSVNDSRGGRE
ncbi:MAG: hypothetical protein JWO30_1735 [Fibrobacteres bacterium]|nr:hypothetical protein [Fibrobacterota bacterium]